MTTQYAFLFTSSTSPWEVPSDLLSVTAVYTFGAGQAGYNGASSAVAPGASGGIGGACSILTAPTFTPGDMLAFSVGAGGARNSNGAAGGDTWLKNAGGTIICLAKGGGSATANVGTTSYAGGISPTRTANATYVSGLGGTGGGGCAGPGGAGGDGGDLSPLLYNTGGGAHVINSGTGGGGAGGMTGAGMDAGGVWSVAPSVNYHATPTWTAMTFQNIPGDGGDAGAGHLELNGYPNIGDLICAGYPPWDNYGAYGIGGFGQCPYSISYYKYADDAGSTGGGGVGAGFRRSSYYYGPLYVTGADGGLIGWYNQDYPYQILGPGGGGGGGYGGAVVGGGQNGGGNGGFCGGGGGGGGNYSSGASDAAVGGAGGDGMILIVYESGVPPPPPGGTRKWTALLGPAQYSFAPNTYVADAVTFDGNTYLNCPNLTAAVSGNISLSFWTKPATFLGGLQTIFNTDGDNADYNDFFVQPLATDNVYTSWVFTSAPSYASDYDADSDFYQIVQANGWVHILFSAECDLASGSRRSAIYMNNNLIVQFEAQSGPAFTIPGDGLPMFVGANNSSFFRACNGDFADIWIVYGLSLLNGSGLIPSSTRDLFIDNNGKPRNPSGFPGGTPTVLFSGDATTFATNQGSGGSFSVGGDALTNAATSPSD